MRGDGKGRGDAGQREVKQRNHRECLSESVSISSLYIFNATVVTRDVVDLNVTLLSDSTVFDQGHSGVWPASPWPSGLSRGQGCGQRPSETLEQSCSFGQGSALHQARLFWKTFAGGRIIHLLWFSLSS